MGGGGLLAGMLRQEMLKTWSWWHRRPLSSRGGKGTAAHSVGRGTISLSEGRGHWKGGDIHIPGDQEI